MEIKEYDGMREVETKIPLAGETVLTVRTVQFMIDKGMPGLGWSGRDWSSSYKAANGGKTYEGSQLKLKPETQALVDEAIKAQQIALGVYVSPEVKAQQAAEMDAHEASSRRIEWMGNMGDSEAN